MLWGSGALARPRIARNHGVSGRRVSRRHSRHDGVSPMTLLRCAILDDYMNLALTIADWSKIGDRVDVTAFNEPFASPEAAARALKDFEAGK